MKHIIILSVLLALAVICSAQWTLNESFEADALPAGWIVYDDGDGLAWHPYNGPSYAHSGNYSALCSNYLPADNSDWLITPPLSISQGDSLCFYARSWTNAEPVNLLVKVSTTGNSIANFTQLLANLQNLSATYQYQQLSLNAFAGQTIYLAFHFYNDYYAVLVDDVKVGHTPLVQPVLELPPSFDLIQGQTLTLDFTPYITCTNINASTLSVTGNDHVDVVINGRNVALSCPDWTGSEILTFTLTDNISQQQATDDVVVNVLPVPAVDLALTQITLPRGIEYVSHHVFPQVTLVNLGNTNCDAPIQVQCAISDSEQVCYSGQATYDQTLPPNSPVQVMMPAGWVPAQPGEYTVLFQILYADVNPANDTVSKSFEVVVRQMTGGPDSFGYCWIDSNAEGGPEYVWNDICATGQSAILYNVQGFDGDDNLSEPIDFGFSFPFYGTDYSHFYVDTNGELLLAENNWYIAYPGNGWDGDGNMFNYLYPIPGYAQMPGLIAPYWDDLIAEAGTGNVFFQAFGTEPNRRMVVQWDSVRFYAGTGVTSLLKFQSVLHENGEICFYYHTTQTGQSGSVVPHNNGRSATVALQNEAANIGLCYLRELVQNNNYLGVEPPGNLLHDGLAIRFYSGPDVMPPVITHVPVGNTFSTYMTLKAHIIDLSDITVVNLNYYFNNQWHTLPPSQVANGDYMFNLTEIPTGTLLAYYFTSTDVFNNTAYLPANAPLATYSFQILPTAGTRILLARSGTQDYDDSELAVYQQVLGQLGVGYDLYDWQEYPSYRFPDQYDAILCYATTGISGPASDSLSIALMEYLESGTSESPKNAFFSSDGWAFGQGGDPNSSPEKKLLEAYFRTDYVATGSGGGTNGLAGPDYLGYVDGTLLITSNSPTGTPGAFYDVYANSPDCVFRLQACPDWYAGEVQYPELGSSNALAFEDGPINGQAYLYHGVCATSIVLPIYKAYYFSFDFSQLNVPAQRQAFLHDLLDWFGVMEVAAEDNAVPVPEVSLQANHPNPFRERTEIGFSVSSSKSTRLEVYNCKGQLVKTLVSGPLKAGSHTASWDATDNSARPVASGVYYCRLVNGGRVHTRKMLLLK